MSKPMIITIDGPAGVGKSTMAKKLSDAMGIAYLDTGAMFRAVAWRLGDGSWKWDKARMVEELGWIQFALCGSGGETELNLNGYTVGDEIRTEQVGMWASNVATIPEVRTFLREAQIVLGDQFPLVAEGRDMGTVVFPDAERKFFLDASVDVRARRRYDQLKDMGKPANLRELKESIAKRDHQDRNREVAPLKPARDAVIIDTSDMGKDTVFKTLLDGIK